MTESQPGAETQSPGAGVQPEVLAVLRNAPRSLRLLAVASLASAALLLAVAACLLALLLLAPKSDGLFVISRLPLVALFVGASACAAWFGVRARTAAVAIRGADERATPQRLRLALLAQADAWHALAMASLIVALFPLLLLGAAVWSLALRLD